MRRWLHWRFVVPRLLLCVVAAIGAHFAAGHALRSIAGRSGAQLLGAKVDVAKARVSLSNGHILLGAMRIADPRCPAESLVTAVGCELEVEGAPLLAKQTVISKARMRGVQIGASATRCDSKSRAEVNAASWFNDHAVEAAADRLASIGDRFDEKFLCRLESVRRTTEFCTTWPTVIAALDSRASELERSATELEKIVGTVGANQLRHSRSLDEIPAKVAELRQALESLSNDFDGLPRRLEEERRLIVAARKQDAQFVRGKLHVETIDAKLLNAYLLREQVAPSLEHLIAWLRSVRQVVPAEPARQFGAKRGQDVLFAGRRPTPNFLIRSLELQGKARFAAQPVAFHGLVSNLTTMPSLLDEPIQVRFSAKDSMPLEVRATIDRTGGRVHDELFVDCQEISLGDQSLGRAEQLQLKLAPSTGSVTVSVTVEGEKLTGEVQLVQKQVRMTPAFAGQDKLPIGESLDQSLGQLNSLATRISLDGTIEQPKCTLWSNLGPAVAEALEHGLKRQAKAHARTVLADARRHVDERLAELERQVAERRERFAAMTSSMPQRIDAVAQLHTRRERMSAEQLGRRLPTTSILR